MSYPTKLTHNIQTDSLNSSISVQTFRANAVTAKCHAMSPNTFACTELPAQYHTTVYIDCINIV